MSFEARYFGKCALECERGIIGKTWQHKGDEIERSPSGQYSHLRGANGGCLVRHLALGFQSVQYEIENAYMGIKVEGVPVA